MAEIATTQAHAKEESSFFIPKDSQLEVEK
jgi:hypothetical protein